MILYLYYSFCFTNSMLINDCIYAEQTSGLLERVTSIDRLQVSPTNGKWVIQTELVSADELLALLNQSDTFNLHVELNRKSELTCKGGNQSNASMFILDESDWSRPAHVGNLVAGRPTSRLAMHIVSKRALNDSWLLFECVPIVSLTVQANASQVLGRDTIGGTLTHAVTNSFKFDFPGNIGNINLTMNLVPTLTYSFEYDFNLQELFALKRFGAKVVVDATLDIKVTVDLTDLKVKLPKITLLKNKTLRSFVVPIAGIPVPGSLVLDVDDQVSLEAKEATSIKASLDTVVKLGATLNDEWSSASGFTGANVDYTGPTLSSITFNPSEYTEKSTGATLIVNNTITPKLTAKLPSLLVENDALMNATLKLLPAWLQKPGMLNDLAKKQLPDYLKLTLSLSVPVYVQAVLKLCSVNCVSEASKPLSATVTAGIEQPDVALKLVELSKKTSIPLRVESDPWQYCLPKPRVVPCARTDSQGHCVCACPDGSQPTLVGNTYKCVCTCLDGRESTQLDDGTCNCTCACPDKSKSKVTALGCPCACKCDSCTQSNKYYDEYSALIAHLPNANADGCICATDQAADALNCYWTNCALKCRKCPGDPACGRRAGNDQTWAVSDVHFATFDKKNFDFQGLGEYTYCMDAPNDFGIQIRTLWHNGFADISWIGGVAVKLRQSTLTVYAEKNNTFTIRLDGRLVVTDTLLAFDDVSVNINW